MPVLVATSRMYRGEHHPTDVLGSVLFAALWLTATYVLIRPNAEAGARTRPHIPGARRRKPAATAARG
jgi:undecaprenyl-diphosphatase